MNITASKRALRAGLGIGVAVAAASFGTYAAFTDSTASQANEINTGTVVIADNDSNAAMYSITNAKPGVTTEKCIKVTYTGTMDSDVKLYTGSTLGALGPYVDLQIMPGTQASPSFPSCTGFTPDAGGAIFTGTLSDFATAHSSWANGLVDNPGAATKWITNDTVVYRFRVTVQDVAAAAGKATGQHTFTWEARNQ